MPSIKEQLPPRAIVASIADLAGFEALHALENTPHTPDCIELRLDALYKDLDAVKKNLPLLQQTPLIITARDPREGGKNELSLQQRTALLLQYLPHADLVDIELANFAHMQSVLTQVKKQQKTLIASLHDFNETPDFQTLYSQLKKVEQSPAHILKIATTLQRPNDLCPLLNLLATSNFPLSLMGMGTLGPASRLYLATSGSVLNYASLGAATAPGQLSVHKMKEILKIIP